MRLPRWLACLLWWRKPRYKGVTIEWDQVSKAVGETFIPVIRDDVFAENVIYLALRRQQLRPRLIAQIKGWQFMSPHLGPKDSWACFRAIVRDYYGA